MADVETTIKSSGGDYTSLYNAEDDDFGCTSGQSALCEYAEEMTDTTAVTINTSVPSDVEISVQSSYRHEGDVTAGAVLAPSSPAIYAIQCQVSGVSINYLRIDQTNVTSIGINFGNTGGNNSFSHLLLHNIQSGDAALRSYGTSVVTGHRSIASGSASSTTGFLASSSGTLTLYNCTAYVVYACYSSSSGTYTTYNCIGFVSNASNRPWDGTFSGDYNADNTSNSSYQAPGSNSQNNLTATDELTNPANEDFTVKSTSTGVKDNGYDYGSPYTDADIAGNSMNGTPDIGAFEYVAGGTTIPVFMRNYRNMRNR